LKLKGGRPPVVLRVSQRALSKGFRAASAAFPLETGGICLGWRDGTGLEVMDLVEIPDPHSTGTSYLRSRDTAALVLAKILKAEPPGSLLGYVGEWHSHPAPQRASSQDKRELRHVSGLTAGVVGLMVLQWDSSTQRWEVRSHLASRSKVRSCETVIVGDAPEADFDSSFGPNGEQGSTEGAFS
jgi:hypothetical protein